MVNNVQNTSTPLSVTFVLGQRLLLFIAFAFNLLQCHAERSRRIFDSLFCKSETLTKRHWITFYKSKNATRGQDAFSGKGH